MELSEKIFTKIQIMRIQKELEKKVPNPPAYAVLPAIETDMRAGVITPTTPASMSSARTAPGSPKHDQGHESQLYRKGDSPDLVFSAP